MQYPYILKEGLLSAAIFISVFDVRVRSYILALFNSGISLFITTPLLSTIAGTPKPIARMFWCLDVSSETRLLMADGVISLHFLKSFSSISPYKSATAYCRNLTECSAWTVMAVTSLKFLLYMYCFAGRPELLFSYPPSRISPEASSLLIMFPHVATLSPVSFDISAQVAVFVRFMEAITRWCLIL